MSVWKKASKSNQRVHRERHQPAEREHLGLLEKKKDYIQRARDYNDKKATLKLLSKRALNKNPDEFYHHMINARVDARGRHIEKKETPSSTKDEDAEQRDENTPQQLKFKRTEDLAYVTFKRTQELKKIERMQAQLHLINVDTKKSNKRIIFPKNIKLEPETTARSDTTVAPSIDADLNELKEATKRTRGLYRELGRRVQRERELAVIQEKLLAARRLESGGNVLKPKKIKKGTKESAPVYQWKYERRK